MSITDDVKVDTRITPALHPGVVENIDGYGDDTKDVLAQVMTAFSTAYENVRSVWDAREKVEQDTSKTADARLLQLDGFAAKKLESATRTFDATSARITTTIRYLEGELAQPIAEKASGSVAAEIRAHAKSLPTDKLHQLISDAVDGGDSLTVGAVLMGPAYLSGLTPDLQKTYLKHWNQKQRPDVAKRLHVLQQAKAMLDRDAGKVFVAMEKAVGGTSTKARQVRLAQMAADKATSA
ncbi:hypothetical protein EF888_02310 [Silicimonas algicola]|uniref:Uncharacterized protein n=1 Tax=Silicimonas algicola TaxID=1826607 RepID=A0A316GDP8_9RHOB|nr:hypothetical protein [Silicimonas algicola]AZQ66057.1 hypothetical protein EF888_02310 [Silicimonas algicola]PWK58355.1 hypothetical protein C8D95_101168 [Silicimonas algicola]